MPRARVAMVTLTYRDDEDWQPRDVSDLLKHMRQWAARRGFPLRGLWVMETTKRGRPHYHVLLWLPRGLTLPKPDKQGWWRKGMTRIEYARRPVGYAAKYASKGAEGIPKGARIHGQFGLEGDVGAELRWWKRPEWLRQQVAMHQTIRRRRGGGWFDAETGEIYESPWRVIFDGGAVWIEMGSGLAAVEIK